jgi:hypothetical protein
MAWYLGKQKDKLTITFTFKSNVMHNPMEPHLYGTMLGRTLQLVNPPPILPPHVPKSASEPLYVCY